MFPGCVLEGKVSAWLRPAVFRQETLVPGVRAVVEGGAILPRREVEALRRSQILRIGCVPKLLEAFFQSQNARPLLLQAAERGHKKPQAGYDELR